MIATLCSLLATAIPLQGTLIAVDSNRALYQLNTKTGVKTQVGTVVPAVGVPGALAYDSNSKKLFLSSTSQHALYVLQYPSGLATRVGFYSDGEFLHGLEFVPSNGSLYGITSETEATLFQINPLTASANQVNSHIGGGFYHNLGYNSQTGVLYMAADGPPASLYTINTSNGDTSLIGSLGAFSITPSGMAFDSQNKVMYLIDNFTDMLCKVDLQYGTALPIGSTGSGNLLGLAYLPPTSKLEAQN